MLPDRETCLELLETAGCSADIVEHVHAVERLASRFAQHAPTADPAVVQAGALLHDVGRGFDHGVDHVPEGIRFLEAQGVDERVVACVAAHMGAGIDETQAAAWGWPPDRRYEPETVEQRIVAHADNLTFHTRYASLDEVLAKLEAKDLADVLPRMRALHEALEAQLGVDPEDVAAELDAECSNA